MKSTLRVFQSFRKKILNFIRPSQISFFDIHNPKGIKLITRLRLGLSHLREHKFKHSFQDKINPIYPLCNCGQNIASATHFSLHCPFFINERRTLLSTIRSPDSKLLDCTDYDLTETLLFGHKSQTSSNNFKIINASIYYILSSKWFDEPLFKINSFISKSEFNQWFSFFTYIHTFIAHKKKYLQSDWLRGVQHWPYLYSVFNICTLWLNKKKNTTFEFRSGKIEMYSLKTN